MSPWIGMNSDRQSWWQHLAPSLLSLGFYTSSVDNNVWRHPVYVDKNNIILYGYICVHVDDFAIIAEDVSLDVAALQKIYTIRHVTSILNRTFYLDMDMKRDMCFRGFIIGVKTYVVEALKDLEKLFGKVDKIRTPSDPNISYVIPSSPPLVEKEHGINKSAVGMFSWITYIGRIDITYATRLLSRFSAGTST